MPTKPESKSSAGTTPTMVIDLRSDTVTKPSPAMLAAMSGASLGDNGYLEDASTNELEQYCATLFGKEAAIFLPSGTMANQLALRCFTAPGDEIIVDRSYHIIFFEAGPTADLAKVYPNVIVTPDGILTAERVDEALHNKARTRYGTHAKLLCLENPINGCGGRITPLATMSQVFEFAKRNGLAVHLDGARLLNACAATGIGPATYGQYTDSLMVCLSKGLGAPFGSMLMSSADVIDRARRYCKWYGGGMHQSGPMAAAALHALRFNREQLAIDNENARYLAGLLQGIELLSIDAATVDTNIVLMDISSLAHSAAELVEHARTHGLLLYPWSRKSVRAVTHRDVSRVDLEEAARRLRRVIGELRERAKSVA